MKKAFFGYRMDREKGRFRWCVEIWHDAIGSEIEHVWVGGRKSAWALAKRRNLNLVMR